MKVCTLLDDIQENLLARARLSAMRRRASSIRRRNLRLLYAKKSGQPEIHGGSRWPTGMAAGSGGQAQGGSESHDPLHSVETDAEPGACISRENQAASGGFREVLLIVPMDLSFLHVGRISAHQNRRVLIDSARPSNRSAGFAVRPNLRAVMTTFLGRLAN